MEIGLIFLLIIACVVLVYFIIPDLLLHRMGFGSWKRQYSPGVAITFDDGPSPSITPKILEILAKHDIKGTFFVVGEEAARYPEVIKQITAQGHKIGAHSQRHKYALFTSPWRTWQEWQECITTLENISQSSVEWIRPPWGTFNLVTWVWLKLHAKRAVLWTVEGQDWLASNTPEQIAGRVLKRVKDGAIIVLHDAGGQVGAPEKTVAALEIICNKIVEERKLPIVELEFPDWSVSRRLTFSLFRKWERLFERLNRIEYVNSTNIIRLAKITYKGPNLYADDGLLLAHSGDVVCELHMDSIRLQADGDEADIQRLGIRALRKARVSLPGLAQYVSNNPSYKGIEVFLGVTLLNRGVQGLGFHVEAIPRTKFSLAVGQLQRLIMRIYHPLGRARKQERLGNQPKLIWISRKELLERWLTQGVSMRNTPIGR